jgi:hypothetical protein
MDVDWAKQILHPAFAFSLSSLQEKQKSDTDSTGDHYLQTLSVTTAKVLRVTFSFGTESQAPWRL